MANQLANCAVRLSFAAWGPLARCHPPDLLKAVIATFEGAGLKLAHSQEKRPRPLASLAYPLPLGAEGLEEWADVTLIGRGAQSGAGPSLAVLNGHCPEGLELLTLEQIPLHASPVEELCISAHWRWHCPASMIKSAKYKIGAFAESGSFTLTKGGKVDGKKATKTVEVRGLVSEIAWHGAKGSVLDFTTAIVQGHALNPFKLLGAILGIQQETAERPQNMKRHGLPLQSAGSAENALGRLQRLRIGLKPDPRLDRHDKYAHKLRNIYEDAVLLEAGPNLVVYDEDDGLLEL